ncbi:MAG TPA: hypothetical protein DCP91_00380 [Eggerthellaceae bacterium]|nr:hypothetical protein [Eggerthellaceae bacterium]
MAKEYGIYCITKRSGKQYLHFASICAGSVKEAKESMKRSIEDRYYCHAFSLGTKPGGSWNWEYITEKSGTTMEQITEEAAKHGGYWIH